MGFRRISRHFKNRDDQNWRFLVFYRSSFRYSHVRIEVTRLTVGRRCSILDISRTRGIRLVFSSAYQASNSLAIIRVCCFRNGASPSSHDEHLPSCAILRPSNCIPGRSGGVQPLKASGRAGIYGQQLRRKVQRGEYGSAIVRSAVMAHSVRAGSWLEWVSEGMGSFLERPAVTAVAELR